MGASSLDSGSPTHSVQSATPSSNCDLTLGGSATTNRRTGAERLADARQFLVYRLQFLRGICVTAVIATHATAEYSDLGMGWLAAALITINSLARFAVPVFVLLSGFYLSLNSRNQHALRFYQRTLQFLVVPYVLYSFVYTLVFEMPLLPIAALPRTFLRTLAFGNAAYHLWFMLMVLELYVVHPFLARWFRAQTHRGEVVLLAFCVQVVWSLILHMELLPHDLLLRLALVCTWFVSHIGYFLAGYYLHEHADAVVGGLRKSRTIIVGAALFLLTGIGIGLHFAAPLAGETPFEDIAKRDIVFELLLPALSVAALPVILKCADIAGGWAAKRSVFARTLNSLGLYSYGVYYLHPLALVLLSSVLSRYASLDSDDVLYYIILLPAVCFLSLAGTQVLSKTPFGRYVT